MWAASFYWQCMSYQFGNCASFPSGNFNGMAACVNYMGFSSANMFTFSCGYVFPAPPCNPYAMAPGNFFPFPAVPPSSFNAGYYQKYEVDHRRGLNASPTRNAKAVSPVPPCNFNDGYYRNYKVDRPRSLSAILPRNANAASQRSFRPSVSQFTENPEQYPGFVLVMVIST